MDTTNSNDITENHHRKRTRHEESYHPQAKRVRHDLSKDGDSQVSHRVTRSQTLQQAIKTPAPRHHPGRSTNEQKLSKVAHGTLGPKHGPNDENKNRKLDQTLKLQERRSKASNNGQERTTFQETSKAPVKKVAQAATIKAKVNTDMKQSNLTTTEKPKNARQALIDKVKELEKRKVVRINPMTSTKQQIMQNDTFDRKPMKPKAKPKRVIKPMQPPIEDFRALGLLPNGPIYGINDFMLMKTTIDKRLLMMQVASAFVEKQPPTVRRKITVELRNDIIACIVDDPNVLTIVDLAEQHKNSYFNKLMAEKSLFVRRQTLALTRQLESNPLSTEDDQKLMEKTLADDKMRMCKLCLWKFMKFLTKEQSNLIAAEIAGFKSLKNDFEAQEIVRWLYNELGQVFNS